MTYDQNPNRRYPEDTAYANSVAWMIGIALVLIAVMSIAFSYNFKGATNLASNPPAASTPSTTGSGSTGNPVRRGQPTDIAPPNSDNR
jgi:hypothetical protein